MLIEDVLLVLQADKEKYKQEVELLHVQSGSLEADAADGATEVRKLEARIDELMANHKSALLEDKKFMQLRIDDLSQQNSMVSY